MNEVKVKPDPRLLVGFDRADDAGVFKLTENIAIIQTVDFLTPMVDDPFLFGQIAAANALSDVYAMGGEPLTVMNIVCFPKCLDLRVLQEIIKGGLTKIEEAGATLVGGHTVDDTEPKYGLSVTGVIDPARVVSNACAREGDYLYLTKPLGSGIVSTAIKGEMASELVVSRAANSMATLNKAARDAMMRVGIESATDVTGFGLLGHTMEMAEGSGVAIELWSEALPVLTGVEELAQMGLIPGGAYSNRDYLKDRISFSDEIDEWIRDLMYSPETSGGLVIAVTPERKADLERAFKELEVKAAAVGRVKNAGRVHIKVTRREQNGYRS